VKRHLQASSRLARHLNWPGLAQVCKLERTTWRNGKETVEIEYAITSLPPERFKADGILRAWVGHWGIENRLHWVRDVTCGEDACRVRTGHAPQNLAAFRNAALTLLRLSGIKEILPTLRTFSQRPLDLLKFLGRLKN
jgi:Transposase DDE domain